MWNAEFTTAHPIDTALTFALTQSQAGLVINIIVTPVVCMYIWWLLKREDVPIAPKADSLELSSETTVRLQCAEQCSSLAFP